MDNHYSVGSDEEPEFVEFDKILEHFDPGISFLQYKRLCSDLVHVTGFTDYEYYGKPQLIEICKYLGVDHLQYDDGVREN